MKKLEMNQMEMMQGGGFCSSLGGASWWDVPSWAVRAINRAGAAMGCWIK